MDNNLEIARRALAKVYKAHPEFSTQEKFDILLALGIGETGIGEILCGKAHLTDTGQVIGAKQDEGWVR